MHNARFWTGMPFPALLVTHLVGRYAEGEPQWMWWAWGAVLAVLTVLVALQALQRPA